MLNQAEQYQNQVARLQRIIREKDRNIQEVLRQNDALKKNPREMHYDNQSEQGMQKDDEEQFLNKTELLENTIKGMTYQISTLEKTCRQRDQRIFDLHQKLLETESLLREKDYQLGALRAVTLDNSEEIIRGYQTKIQQLIAIYEQQNQHTIALITQNKQLQNQISKQRQKTTKIAEAFQNHVRQYEQLVDKFSKEAEKQQKIIDEEQLQMLKQCLFDQDKQIQQKNLEMVELYYRLSQNHDATLSQSIQFMKQLIQQKTHLVKSSLKKMYEADKLIKQLSKQVQLRRGMPQKVEELNRQLQKQRQLNASLKAQVLMLRKQNLKKVEEDNKRANLLEDILLQNQHYQAIMFETYGRNYYKAKIEEVKRKMLSEMEMRKKQRRWVNISELIQVNQALMKIVSRNS